MHAVLGIDGGASKTVAVVADEQGCELGRGVAGPSNHFAVGMDSARAEIAQACATALRQSGLEGQSLAAVCAGLSGVTTPPGTISWEQILRQTVTAERYVVEHDAIIALAGAIGRLYGVVVVAGTGSVAVGVDDSGRRARAGGWGHLFGDEGSGYDLGRRAVIAMLRAHDGRGSPTIIKSMILAHLGLSRPEDMIERGYVKSMDKHQLASLAPLIPEAARSGDVAARQILQDAGMELGVTALAVIRQLEWSGTIPVALAGGMADEEGVLFQTFRRTVQASESNARVTGARQEPVIGAVLLALRAAAGATAG